MISFFRKRRSFLFILLAFALLSRLFLSCSSGSDHQLIINKKISDLDQIKRKGKLVVISDYNSTAYFFYRGTPMGFNYEILRAFSDYLGVGLSISITNSYENSFKDLAKDSCDIVALDLPVTQERSTKFFATTPLIHAAPVLVQRRPSAIERKNSKAELVLNPAGLAGKHVYLSAGSPFAKQLFMHSIESGDTISIVENPELHTDQLISAVANKKIDYTVAYETSAHVNQMYYPSLDVNTKLGPEQNLVWAVSKNKPVLFALFNKWLINYKKTRHYEDIYEKYFKNRRTIQIVGSELYSVGNNKISVYDNDIKKYSKHMHWDWRLFASLIYHESNFHPQAKAWSGAYGLLQLMPWVMEEYGLDSISSPSQQIAAGARYIESIDKQFRSLVKDPVERQKFVLAAYNVGLAHVFDARRLAKKYGKKDDIWTNQVDSFILRKSEPRYYRDRLAFYGYCRGEEPFNFVMDVLEMYNLYKNVIKN